MWRFGYSVSYSCFAPKLLLMACQELWSKFPCRLFLFLRSLHSLPYFVSCSVFAWQDVRATLPFDASLCGDEPPSCWIATQITENRYQFIAVWFGKGINPTLCLYGVSLVVKPLFGDLWFTVWVTLQSKSFRAQCAEGRMFDPFAQKGNCAALL